MNYPFSVSFHLSLPLLSKFKINPLGVLGFWGLGSYGLKGLGAQGLMCLGAWGLRGLRVQGLDTQTGLTDWTDRLD